MIIVKEIFTKSDRKKFFKFPIDLYKDNNLFVPTLIADEESEFNPNENGAFDYCECKMFLAYKDDVVVGRVSCILNKAYNVKKDVMQLRFTRFDFIDDYEVSSKLFEEVIKVANSYKMNEIIGPIGFSDLDKQGMLVEGFEYEDLYITIYNFEYYIAHMEKLGLVKEADWVEYRIYIPNEINPRIDRIANAVMKRNGYKVLKLKNKKELKPWIVKALDVLNESFAKLFGVVELSQKQMDDFSSLLLMLARMEYITAVLDKEDNLVGYGFVAPNISDAMRKSKGKISIMTLLRLKKALGKHNVVDFYSIGVKPSHQNKGVNAIILNETLKALIANKVEYCETGPELENNVEIQAQWETFDKLKHKRRRCYSFKITE